MPLSINVGLSRKASKDYQSTGFSINVNAELDQALLAKPEELQRQIDDLYAQAAQAIERQLHSSPTPGSSHGGNTTPGTAPAAGAQRSEQRNYRDDHRESRGFRNGRQQERPRNDDRQSNGHGGHGSTSGGGGASGAGGSGGGMTESQRRAIEAIASRIELNPDEEARVVLGLALDTLSVREASRFIDHLKTIQPAPAHANGSAQNGGGR